MAAGRFSKLEKSREEKGGLEPPAGAISRDGPTEKPAPKPRSAKEADGDNYPTFIQRADEAFFSGNYKDALRHYSRALQEDPTHVYPWIGQVSALIGMRQFREAELWTNRALDQFPEESSLLSQRARVLAATGNLKRAIGLSDYALGQGATEWTWLARGEVLLEASDNNSLYCFEKAMEMAEPTNWRIPLVAGLTFGRKRQWASAEEFLKISAERNPKNGFTWLELARVLMELNYTDRARDALQRARQLNASVKDINALEIRLYRRPLLQRMFGMLKR
ncbi:MAG: tetratricopeptide repeat protein [Candidatus Sumerlaeia bacterium]|nr:tetratricopeptide repeat protein [Candidatus Sumerlaeia bacterium]